MLKNEIRSLIENEIATALKEFSTGEFHCSGGYKEEDDFYSKFSNPLSALATSTIEGNDGEPNATKAYVAKAKKELKKQGINVNEKITGRYKVIDAIIEVGAYIENVDIFLLHNTEVKIVVFNKVKNAEKFLNNIAYFVEYTPEEFIELMQQRFN